VWGCGRLPPQIVGSNPAEGMEVCLLWSFCVVRHRAQRRAGHSSRGVAPSVVCLTECDMVTSTMNRPWPCWAAVP
jgi:hypothetical protein